jgi:hypothetical protein
MLQMTLTANIKSKLFSASRKILSIFTRATPEMRQSYELAISLYVLNATRLPTSDWITLFCYLYFHYISCVRVHRCLRKLKNLQKINKLKTLKKNNVVTIFLIVFVVFSGSNVDQGAQGQCPLALGWFIVSKVTKISKVCYYFTS